MPFKKQRLLILCIVSLCFFVFQVHAATNDGTIDSINKYAWSENIGWVNFGNSDGNVHVRDSGLTGYAWSDTYGWINLNPSESGVTNNAEGTLDGQAWGENVGYINFSGVTIDSDGYFLGYATGDITGQISFNCINTDTCASSDFKVQTDWRPASTRVSGGAGGGGGGRRPNPSQVVVVEEVTGEESLLENCNDDLPFQDVAEDAYGEDIMLLYCLGIIHGKTGTRFEPKGFITRAESLKIVTLSLLLYENDYFPLPEMESPKTRPFPDVYLNEWHVPFVNLALERGIVHGYPTQKFKPHQIINSAEFAKIMAEAYWEAYPEQRIEFSDEMLNWYDPYLEHLHDGPNQNMTRSDAVHLLVDLWDL